MIKPRIESIKQLNGLELEELDIKDPEQFGLVVRVMIGPSTGEGQESFDFNVCSTAWLVSEIESQGYLMARRLLILPAWDPEVVRKAITDAVSSIAGESWQDLTLKLLRIARWEFENAPKSGPRTI